MKKYACIQTVLALVLLAAGCTLPPVHDPTLRRDPETKTATSPLPEKPAPAAPPQTKGKRVSLIPQGKEAQPARETPPDKATPPAVPVQEAPPALPQPEPPQPQQPQTFTDYHTGLAFTYQRPWHLVSSRGEGPILGRDGHSQLTARFATLTADKAAGAQPGYFYVPEDSLTGTIGKKISAILGLGDRPAAQEKTPLDVLLTHKQFPSLIIEKRYRGNNGGVVVQKCRHKLLPGPIQVYHIFIGDKVASFSLAEVKNRQLKLEMQQIVLSTRKL